MVNKTLAMLIRQRPLNILKLSDNKSIAQSTKHTTLSYNFTFLFLHQGLKDGYFTRRNRKFFLTEKGNELLKNLRLAMQD